MGADMERSQYDFPAVRPFVIVAALSLFAGRTTAQPTGYDVADELKSNVVRIEAKFADHTENGFGFIVGERGGNLYVATANHVVYQEDAADLAPATVKVEFYDRQGTMFDANLIGTHDVAHDLAVLTVAPPQGFEWKKQCLGRAEHRKHSSEVWFIGKSRHWVVPVIPGRVASEEIIDGQMDLEALPIQPGSSGGPLVASSGIVGIVLRDAEDNATALDITYVKSYFKKWNHPWDLEAAVPGTTVAQASPAEPAPINAPAPVVPKETESTPAERTPKTARVDPDPAPAVDPAQIFALMGTLMQSRTTDRCRSGYVWREARSSDHVCVTTETRQQTAAENASAAARRNPNGGAYGRDTCLEGYVWRDAFRGDRVCVTVDSRNQAAEDNREASSRVR